MLRRRVARLPDRPGVYLFSDAAGRLLYVGKAVSLRKRVGSYFRLPAAPRGKRGAAAQAGRTPALSPRIAQMMRHVAGLDVRLTASEAEALLLEAQLIKECRPRYNVAFRDDKAYPMLKITHEPFPRLMVTRRRANDGARYFGPYTDASLMHEAVRFLRRVFPMRTCRTFPKSPCLEYHLGQCLAPCAGYITAPGYQRIVDDLAAFLRGERDQLLTDLSRRMARAARAQRFEDAARLRDQIQALTSVIVAKEKSLAAGPLEQLQAALKLPCVPRRIEAFDVSNIFGAFAVGSMVVFSDGKPHKAHYRRFRIETVPGIDDYRMMREIIRRRYSGTLARQLPLPELIVVDGGKGQLSAACEELAALSLALPAMGLAKRFEHIFLPSTPEPIVLLPTSPVLHLLQHLRDEAHRFAITYHRRLRGRSVSASVLHEIRGIGRHKASRLLAHFGSLKRLAAAPVDEVASVARVSAEVAAAVLERLATPSIRVFNIRGVDVTNTPSRTHAV
ncbi:MAG: excinuclease ABC subunit UvrC [Candidatus Omnitrophica bacterium]|nr:excinuclease ABC subunit UvrC [Candidatus Omnitrophota bacterium]